MTAAGIVGDGARWRRPHLEHGCAGYCTPEDDGTEAESLAEVCVPKLPEVLVHGRSGAA